MNHYQTFLDPAAGCDIFMTDDMAYRTNTPARVPRQPSSIPLKVPCGRLPCHLYQGEEGTNMQENLSEIDMPDLTQQDVGIMLWHDVMISRALLEQFGGIDRWQIAHAHFRAFEDHFLDQKVVH